MFAPTSKSFYLVSTEICVGDVFLLWRKRLNGEKKYVFSINGRVLPSFKENRLLHRDFLFSAIVPNYLQHSEINRFCFEQRWNLSAFHDENSEKGTASQNILFPISMENADRWQNKPKLQISTFIFRRRQFDLTMQRLIRSSKLHSAWRYDLYRNYCEFLIKFVWNHKLNWRKVCTDFNYEKFHKNLIKGCFMSYVTAIK